MEEHQLCLLIEAAFKAGRKHQLSLDLDMTPTGPESAARARIDDDPIDCYTVTARDPALTRITDQLRREKKR